MTEDRKRPRIHVAGVGDVEIKPSAPADPQQLLAAVGQLIRLVDIDLQVRLRLMTGWEIEDIIRDMNLNVPEPPEDA